MTLREKAEYYDEWEPYFEAFARIRREVVNRIPDYKAMGYSFNDDLFLTASDMADSTEIQTEITNLIRTMLEDISDEKS